MNLFDLSLQFNGFPIKKAERILKGIQAQPDQAFEAYVENKKNEIVTYHIQNNSFYSNLVNGAKVRSLLKSL